MAVGASVALTAMPCARPALARCPHFVAGMSHEHDETPEQQHAREIREFLLSRRRCHANGCTRPASGYRRLRNGVAMVACDEHKDSDTP